MLILMRLKARFLPFCIFVAFRWFYTQLFLFVLYLELPPHVIRRKRRVFTGLSVKAKHNFR